jgi:hypothetical protein
MVFSGAFAGVNVSSDTHIYISPDMPILVPNNYTGVIWKYNDRTQNTLFEGGYFTEGGATPGCNWTCIEMLGDAATADSALTKGVYNNKVRNVYIKRCGDGIRLKTTGTGGWVNGNTIENIWIDYPRVGYHFDDQTNTGGAGISRNFFKNCVCQADPEEFNTMTHGFQDIPGLTNEFHNCVVWDTTANGVDSTIKSTASNTLIVGGMMCRRPLGTWEIECDKGINTQIVGEPFFGSNIALGNPYGKKVGMYVGAGQASSNVRGEGIINAFEAAGASGGAVATLNSTSGFAKQMSTSTTSGGNIAMRNATTFTMRFFNPMAKSTFRLNNSTNVKFFIGWVNGTALLITGADFLANLSGFGLAFDSTSGVSSTNWLIYRNNGGANSTIADSGVAYSSGILTLYLQLEEATPKLLWRLGQNNANTITGGLIPAQTTALTFGAWLANTAAENKTVDYFWSYIKTD